jgi:formylmethanofuran dehydrogenase subunit E
MESLDGLLRKAEATHGHLCAGQILGVQLALLGLIRLGTTDEPRGRRELQIQMKPQAVRMR